MSQLFQLKAELNKVFPEYNHSNIGLKYDNLDKNIYTNEFYHGIVAQSKD